MPCQWWWFIVDDEIKYNYYHVSLCYIAVQILHEFPILWFIFTEISSKIPSCGRHWWLHNDKIFYWILLKSYCSNNSQTLFSTSCNTNSPKPGTKYNNTKMSWILCGIECACVYAMVLKYWSGLMHLTYIIIIIFWFFTIVSGCSHFYRHCFSPSPHSNKAEWSSIKFICSMAL